MLPNHVDRISCSWGAGIFVINPVSILLILSFYFVFSGSFCDLSEKVGRKENIYRKELANYDG